MDDELRDLLGKIEVIRMMCGSEAWQLLQQECHNVYESKRLLLLQGRHQTIDGFKYDAGFVQGIEFVYHAIDRMVDRYDTLREHASGQREAA